MSIKSLHGIDNALFLHELSLIVMNSWWLQGWFGFMSRPCRDALRSLRLSPHCVRCYSYLTPLGWFMYNWKVKIENWKVATFNHYSNLINLTRGEVPCGWGQTLFLCVPRERYLVDWYEVACLRHAWGWSLLPHTAHLDDYRGDLGLCRVHVGTHSTASDYHRTAYGVIHISPRWGDLCTIEKWKVKSGNLQSLFKPY